MGQTTSRSHQGGASRQHTGSGSHTVLSPVYEHRDIRVAHGIQFHQDQIPADWKFETHMDSIRGNFPNVEKVNDFEYRNHRQRVRFTVQETTDKSVFKTWLETPELHVVYNGHARYGRGPCFGRGTGSTQSEDWEEGASPATTGLFRVGFPFIGIPAHECIDHGYTANPMKESEGRPASADCHPEMRAFVGSLRARAPDQIDTNLTARLRNHATGDRYWTYRERERGPLHLVHHAGWENTLSTPNDLGGINMQCRVFAHFGCSTYIHNYPVVRRLAAWRREGNEKYAYWTRQAAYSLTYSRWIANLITYNVENAFQSWEASLANTVVRTNRDVRAEGYRYSVI